MTKRHGLENTKGVQREKFECMSCGCYFWVEDRNDFRCPNCWRGNNENNSI